MSSFSSPLNRDRDAPVEVTGDGPRLELLGEVVAEVQHIGTPVLASSARSSVPRRGGKIEEEMRGLHEVGNFTVNAGMGIDQADRIKLVPAVVAPVAAGELIAADGAGALDIAVGQRATRARRDGPELGLLDDVAIVVEGAYTSVTASWLSVVVRVYRSYDRPSPCRSSTMMRWYLSAVSWAVSPSASAFTWMAVPCSSEPDTSRTSLPDMRIYRAKTSEGTPKPET